MTSARLAKSKRSGVTKGNGIGDGAATACAAEVVDGGADVEACGINCAIKGTGTSHILQGESANAGDRCAGNIIPIESEAESSTSDCAQDDIAISRIVVGIEYGVATKGDCT